MENQARPDSKSEIQLRYLFVHVHIRENNSAKYHYRFLVFERHLGGSNNWTYLSVKNHCRLL